MKMAKNPRLQKKPLEKWSTRERLALASSVKRSGNQNWGSVSRNTKPFGEDDRPADWFSLQNCALQYADLLENVETHRRKRASEASVDTPMNQIVRKLTIERIEQLKQVVQEEENKYKRLKQEIEAIRCGNWDYKIPNLIQQIKEEQQKQLEANVKVEPKDDDVEAAGTSSSSATQPVEVKIEEEEDTIVVVQDHVETEVCTTSDGGGGALGNSAASLTSMDLMARGAQSGLVGLNEPDVTTDRQTEAIVTSHLGGQEVVVEETVIVDDHHIKEETIEIEETVDVESDEVKKEEPDDSCVIEEQTVITDDNVVHMEDETIIEQASSTCNVQLEVVEEQVISMPTDNSNRADDQIVVPPAVMDGVDMLVPSEEGEDQEGDKASVLDSDVTPTTQHTLPTAATTTSPAAKPLTKTETPHTAAADIHDTGIEERAIKEEPKEDKSSIDSPVSHDDECSQDALPPPSAASPVESGVPSSAVGPGGDMIVMSPATPASSTQQALSPASSVVSDVMEGLRSHVGTPGTPLPNTSVPPSKKGGKVKLLATSSRRSSSRRRTKTVEEDRKVSEAGSSDDESSVDHDDYSTKPATPASLAGGVMSGLDSIPNSPASVSHLDTDDEKAYKTWKKSIMLVWRSAANHKYANIFMQPVTDDLAPGYSSVVYRPMDMTTIKKNIEKGAIRTTAEFQRDMMLMFTNAIMYNNSDHNIYHMAENMYNDAMTHIELFVNTQMMVQSEPKVLRTSRRSLETSTPQASNTTDKDDDKKRRYSVDHEQGGKIKKKRI